MNNEQLGMQKVDESFIKDLEKKKYFELKDLDRFKNAWCFFIKGKKGIGKTYSLMKLFNEIDKSDVDLFVYMRTRREDLLRQKESWIRDNSIPFYCKGNTIFSKKNDRICGILGYANNLGSLRSNSYKNFKYIIYDEYIEQLKTNYRNIDDFAKNFMKFVMDVYRDVRNGNVSDLKVYCFGNNDIIYDPITEYFKIDVKDVLFNWDKKLGIVVANLSNYYLGMMKDSKAYGLAYYDEQLEEFLDCNKSYENVSQMINYSELDKGIIEKYIFYNYTYIAFIRLINDKNKYAFRIVNKPIKGLPIWCFESLDYMEDVNSILLQERQIVPFIVMLRDNIKHGNFKFTSSKVKEIIQDLIYMFRHRDITEFYKKH